MLVNAFDVLVMVTIVACLRVWKGQWSVSNRGVVASYAANNKLLFVVSP